ncbi:response regulator transcription factor [Gilvimarinus sp. SDUM040013]|uniref:Response regulator transcription factor n=1 Tax=Gilvimarinus gilvus TaxID=3058038 RepID=A0ABU4S2P9_9GAMM|nr:response regulator transcription factor [Gilvimarinus sp. SDUM040013]MDO3384361.1 response regulator transcription factor [Gilvimarinus sp. SDUM040013]MDX6851209.1 response regulator transcription factor [Gilvimarinus sp. SDUM040013]
MRSVFVTTSNIDSQRWQSAFEEAAVYVDYAPDQVSANEKTLAWLVLDGAWREHLTSLTAAGAKVVALTLNETAVEAREMFALGCSGYLHAMAAPEQLARVKKAIEYDGLWLGRDLMSELLLTPKPPTQQPSQMSLERLSDRERAVAQAVVEGHSNKEVARLLDITERTVKAHLSSCYEKLGVRDRMQLALHLRPGK